VKRAQDLAERWAKPRPLYLSPKSAPEALLTVRLGTNWLQCEAGILLFESGNQTQGLVTRGGVTLRDARFKVTEEVHLREASAVSQESRNFELILLGLLTKHVIMYEAHNPGEQPVNLPLSLATSLMRPPINTRLPLCLQGEFDNIAL